MNHPIPINIRALRKKLGFTQAQFAESVGYSKSRIEKSEALGRKQKTLPPRFAAHVARMFSRTIKSKGYRQAVEQLESEP